MLIRINISTGRKNLLLYQLTPEPYIYFLCQFPKCNLQKCYLSIRKFLSLSFPVIGYILLVKNKALLLLLQIIPMELILHLIWCGRKGYLSNESLWL